MLTDALLNFVAPGSPLSLVAAAGADVPTDPIDLLGSGPGTPVTNIIGNAELPGQADAMGVGNLRPELAVAIGTAAHNGTGTPTLNVQLQYAADDGSDEPDTWQTIAETGPIATANLAAGTIIARFPWLPPFPQNLRPRFIRLNFEIPAATAYDAGTIAYATVTQARDDNYHLQSARNYSVSGISAA